MELAVQLTKEDLWQFNKYIFLHNKANLSNIASSVLIPVGLAVAIGMAMGMPAYLIASLVLFLLITGIPLTVWDMKRRVNKVIAHDPHILEERFIHIDKAGIYERTASFENRLDWDTFQRYEQTDKYIYLFMSDFTAYIFPKRIFSEKKELDDFLVLLQTNLKQTIG